MFKVWQEPAAGKSLNALLDDGRVLHLQDGTPLFYSMCPRDNRIIAHIGDKQKVIVFEPATLAEVWRLLSPSASSGSVCRSIHLVDIRKQLLLSSVLLCLHNRLVFSSSKCSFVFLKPRGASQRGGHCVTHTVYHSHYKPFRKAIAIFDTNEAHFILPAGLHLDSSVLCACHIKTCVRLCCADCSVHETRNFPGATVAAQFKPGGQGTRHVCRGRRW
jgi:hypothetical protein